MKRTIDRPARCAAVAVLALLASAAGTAPAGEGPIRVGERLSYSIQYGFVRAGTSELTVSVDTTDGSLLVRSRAATTPFFDVFFKVRDEIRSWIDPETLRSIRFEKRLCEGNYRDEEMVVFDHERGVAVYDDGKEVPLLPEARDILATFFHFRTQRLPIGGEVPLVYHSSKKNWSIRVDVDKVEMVEVPAGRFRCIRVEPFLKSVGVFKQTGRLRIWVTADERRMPVKLESKVTFGAFEAVLTSYE